MHSLSINKQRLGPNTLPFPVRRGLAKLGKEIREARIRRRIPTSVMANRALINRMTLYKIERGDPTVSVAAYATVLFVLGMINRFADIANSTKSDCPLTKNDCPRESALNLPSPSTNHKAP